MAAIISPSLSFNGNCEEAFNFYKSVFGGEFSYVGRYKEMPSDQPIPDSEKEKIMHISYPIDEKTTLMGGDTSEILGGPSIKFGDNISLVISPESEEDAKRIFNALSEGGEIEMPLEKTFWNALFGSFTDRFGISWMVNYQYGEDMGK